MLTRVSDRVVSLALALLLVAAGSPALDSGESGATADSRSGTLAVKAGRILVGNGTVVLDGTILIENGRIVEVGQQVFVPANVPVLEFPDQTIIPGLVAISPDLAPQPPSRSFFFGSAPGKRSLAPDSMVFDGFDFFADLSLVTSGGVTTLGVTSLSNQLLAGRGMVIKSASAGGELNERVLKKAGGFGVTLGEKSKRPSSVYEPPVPPSPDKPFKVLELQSPVSRGGAFLALNELLERARVYAQAIEAFRSGSGPRPALDSDLAALQELIHGEDYLLVQADRALDLLRAIRFATENRLPMVLDSAQESYRIVDELVEHRIPVVLEGAFMPGRVSDVDLTRAAPADAVRDDLATYLTDKGVAVALRSPGRNGQGYLLYQAIEAVRQGMSPGAALRSITLTPSEILGVSNRVGSLEAGKDADFVVLGDDPFFGNGRPLAVYIAGEQVHPPPQDIPDDVTVVRCGRILTVTQGEIRGGVIVLRDGKIHAVGPAPLLSDYAGAANVIDARREVVIPGLIDTGSKLGIHRDSVVAVESSRDDAAGGTSSGGGRPSYRVADAVDPADPQFKDVVRAGITTVILTPDTTGGIAGQLTAMKLSGAPAANSVIKDPAGLLFSSVDSSLLAKAKKYHDAWSAHEETQKKKESEAKGKNTEEGEPEKKKTGDFGARSDPENKNDPGKKANDEKKKEKSKGPPAPNEEYDVLRQLFRGELLAVVSASNESDLNGVFTKLTDKYEVETLVFGVEDLSRESLAEIYQRNVGVLLGTRLVYEKSPGKTIHLPRRLTEERIRFAFRSDAGSGGRFLPLQVAYAVREGWEREEALRSMTLWPAQLFGLEDRLGSIETGKDADLVFLNGNPFTMTTQVTRVMIDAKMVYEKDSADRQDVR